MFKPISLLKEMVAFLETKHDTDIGTLDTLAVMMLNLIDEEHGQELIDLILSLEEIKKKGALFCIV